MDAPGETTTDQTLTDPATRDPVVSETATRSETADPGLSTADLARGDTTSRAEAGQGQRPDAQPEALFPAEDARTFQTRWDAIQVSFVDEPRRAVEQADALVAEALKRQAEIFAAARADLEGQWDRGQDVSTEDLRQALQRYRAFFTRVLKV